MSEPNTDALTELSALAGLIPAATTGDHLRRIFYRLDEIAARHPDDIDVHLAVGDIKQQIVAAAARLGVKQEWDIATDPHIHALPDKPAPESLAGFGPTSVIPAYTPPGAKAAPAPVAKPAPARSSTPLVLLVLGLAGLGAIGWFGYRQWLGTGIEVRIRTTPPGAPVMIDGETRCTSPCELRLKAGEYRLAVEMDGFEPLTRPLMVAAAKPVPPVELTLVALPQNLKIVSDLGAGTLTMDKRAPAPLTGREFSAEKLEPGHHMVKVTGTGREASFGFELTAGMLPAVSGAITTKNALAVLVSTLGKRARLVTSSGPWVLTVNGVLEGEAGPAGIELKNLKQGDNEIVIGEGPESRSIKAKFDAMPALTAFLVQAQDAGTLTVATGEDGVKVFVNGVEQPRTTAGGQLRLRTLGQVEVSVAKDGFEAPAPKSADLIKDGDVRMLFQLTAKARPAPGPSPPRTVETAKLDLPPAPAASPPGGAILSPVLPPMLPDSPPPATPPPAAPPEAAKPAPPPPPAPGTIADFEDPSAWHEDKAAGLWRHRGQAFLAYKVPANGTFTFDVHALRGGQVQWSVDYANPRDYTLFELDTEGLTVYDIKEGKRVKRRRVSHGVSAAEKKWTMLVDVSPSAVTHNIQRGKEWVQLDKWTQAGRDFTRGRLAFLILGDSETGLSKFRFQPR